MAKSEQKSVRLSEATLRKTEELGRLWGPVKPLSLADVIAVMTDKMHEQETKKKDQAR